MTQTRSADTPAEGSGQPQDPPSDDLSRLAALHGVAVSYRPSPDRAVTASATALTRALTTLGVDASTPAAVAAALTARERELRERLLPRPSSSGPASPRAPPSPRCRPAPG